MADSGAKSFKVAQSVLAFKARRYDSPIIMVSDPPSTCRLSLLALVGRTGARVVNSDQTCMSNIIGLPTIPSHLETLVGCAFARGLVAVAGLLRT